MRTLTINFVGLFSIFTHSLSNAAPITFNTALPISKNELIIREQFISSERSNNDTEINTQSLVSTFVYGLSPKLAVLTTIPLSYAELNTADSTLSESGIGDVRLSGRYTAFSIDAPGKTIRLAPFFGVELATGKYNTNQALNLGSGSYDFFVGVVATYATTNWTTDTQFSYQKNGGSNDIDIGDSFRIDSSLQYRIIPKALTINTKSFVNAVVELNIINQQETTQNSIKNNNASTQVLIAPGLQYISQRWIAETSLQIPLNSDDSTLQTDYIARIGIRANF